MKPVRCFQIGRYQVYPHMMGGWWTGRMRDYDHDPAPVVGVSILGAVILWA